MYFFPIELILVGISCAAIGYALGLRETKRRLKAHKEVTDRLMNAGISASTVYPTYGGISRSGSWFASALGNDANNMFGGAAMQNQVTYSATPSKFASLLSSVRTATAAGRPPTSAPRDSVKRKIYDDIKKEME